MALLVPYYKEHNEFGYSLKPLNPTGKWKLESGPYYKDKMFVEHKGWLFKCWKSEDCIVFRPPKETVLLNCDKPVIWDR